MSPSVVGDEGLSQGKLNAGRSRNWPPPTTSCHCPWQVGNVAWRRGGPRPSGARPGPFPILRCVVSWTALEQVSAGSSSARSAVIRSRAVSISAGVRSSGQRPGVAVAEMARREAARMSGVTSPKISEQRPGPRVMTVEPVQPTSARFPRGRSGTSSRPGNVRVRRAAGPLEGERGARSACRAGVVDRIPRHGQRGHGQCKVRLDESAWNPLGGIQEEYANDGHRGRSRKDDSDWAPPRARTHPRETCTRVPSHCLVRVSWTPNFARTSADAGDQGVGGKARRCLSHRGAGVVRRGDGNCVHTGHRDLVAGASVVVCLPGQVSPSMTCQQVYRTHVSEAAVGHLKEFSAVRDSVQSGFR